MTPHRHLIGQLVVLMAASALTAAPPDDLKRAGEGFEKAVTDAEGKLRASLTAAGEKAKDKAAKVKVAYQVEQFDKFRELPTCVPTKEYTRARDAAIKELASRYEPAVKSLRAKDPDGADELEGEYAALVKKARGFGLAVPDPSTNPVVVIRCKAGDGVLEAVDPKAAGSKVVVSKFARGRASQLWRVERGDGGFALRSAAGSGYLHVPAGSQTEGERLVLWDMETANANFSWKAEERLREVVLVSCFNELALTKKEITEKGQVGTYLVQDKKGKKKAPPEQVWTIEVQK